MAVGDEFEVVRIGQFCLGHYSQSAIFATMAEDVDRLRFRSQITTARWSHFSYMAERGSVQRVRAGTWDIQVSTER